MIEKIKILIFFASLFYFVGGISYAQSHRQMMQDSLEYYNTFLSAEEMKEDLIVLQKVHERTNSGLYYYRSKNKVDSLYKWAHRKIEEPMPKIEFYKIMLQIADFEA